MWKVEYSDKVSLNTTENGFWFDFPKSPGHINMITQESWWGNTLPLTVSMTVKVTSTSPVYVAIGNDETPEAARFYVQRKGDDLSGQGDFEFYRWWSNPVRFELGPQDNTLITVTSPVVGGGWSSVFGKTREANKALFRQAWKNAEKIGITFGGRYFGHGVYLKSGTAKFVLKDFQVL